MCSISEIISDLKYDCKHASSAEDYEECFKKIKKWVGYDLNNELINKIVNKGYERKSIFLKGNVQSGKTGTMTKLALYELFFNKHSICIILNNQTIDFKTWCERFKKNIASALSKTEFNEESDIEELFEQLINTKGTPYYLKITPIICNTTALEKYLKRKQKNKSIIIIDESDSLAVVPEEHNKIAKRRNQIMSIHEKETTSYTLRVTATMYEHFVTKDEISEVLCGDIITLPSENYISYGNSKFVFSSFDKDDKVHFGIGDDINKETLKPIIKRVHDEIISNKRGLSIGYVNITRYISNQYSIQKVLQQKFTKLMCIIVAEGKIVLSFPDSHPLSKKSTLSRREHKHRSKLSIQENLSLIQDDKTKYPNMVNSVIILGCAMVSRGQSLRSEVEVYESYKDIIYAQYSIIATPPKQNTSTLIQTVLRIGGVFKNIDDDFDDLIIYTTPEIIGNMITIMKWDEEVSNMISQKVNEDKLLINIIPSLNKTEHFENDDKLRKVSLYAPKTHTIDNQTFLTKESYDNREQFYDTIEEIDEESPDEYITHFQKWRKKSNVTKIAKFMRCLDTHKEYTEHELFDLVENLDIKHKKVFIQNTQRSHKHKVNGYGKLLIKENNKYKFNPSLRQVYEKHFLKIKK